MNLNPVVRHSRLAMLGVEEPDPNDLHDAIAWDAAERAACIVVRTSERRSRRAQGVGNLRDDRDGVDVEIAEHEVDVEIVLFGKDPRDASPNQDACEFDWCDALVALEGTVWTRNARELGDARGSRDGVHASGVAVGERFDGPALDAAAGLC